MKRFLFLALIFLGGCSRPELIDLSENWLVHHIDLSGIDYRTDGPPPSLYEKITADPDGSEVRWTGPVNLPAAVTMEQAKTIQKIIQGIVTDIEAENRLINESTESILAVKGAANNVNDAVNAIMQLCSGQDKLTELIQKNMNDMNTGSSEISTSTVEQQSAMNGVMETINSLNEVVEQVNRSTANMVDISERLSHRIALLNKIVIEH